MKQILIDGTTISKRMDGLSQYILNVVSRLPQQLDIRYTIIVRPNECPLEYIDQWKKQNILVEWVQIDPIGPKRDYQFASFLHHHAAFDGAIIPSNQFPVSLRIPSIYVVHDIIYERYPEQLGRGARIKKHFLHWNVARGLKQATAVVAVSRFTKQEILHFHPQVNPDKIHTIYEGWEHLKGLEDTDTVSTPFVDYILYIGSSRGHKNLNGLIKAMSLAADRLPENTGLIIAGDDRMLTSLQKAELASMKGRIITTGWLSQSQLNAYSQHAKAIIFPSLCEGFGIPVLEAFYYDKPLLVSKASSLPEVAGDAGIYFDPSNYNEMADKIVIALQMSETERKAWIERGKKRLAAFSWNITAEQISNLLNQILTNK